MNQIEATKNLRRKNCSGQAFFKWLTMIALIAAAALGFLFLNATKARNAEVERLRAENQQEQAKQSDELERLRNENKEIETLRAANQEVVKLRAESAQLRVVQKEQQKLLAENQQLKSTLQQLQQVGSENSNLRNQNQQLQGAIAANANTSACINNLKAIESIKARWAADMQKLPTDVPLDTDLFGPGKYFPQKPVCPSGGVYTVGPVQAKPTCSTPGHIY